MSDPTSFPGDRRLNRRAFLGAVAAAGIVASCGSSSSTNQGPATLTFWKPPGEPTVNQENAFYNSLNAKYKKAHPKVTINHLTVPWADASTKYTAAFSSSSPPDVSYQILPWVNQFGSAGALVPVAANDSTLGSYLKGIPSNVLNSAKDAKGDYYGVPYYTSHFTLAINQDIWKKAGSPKVPTTYAEMAPFAKQLTFDEAGHQLGQPGFDKTRIATYGMAWPGDWTISVNYLYNYFWSYGTDYISKDKKDIGFNNSAGRAALSVMKQMVDSGATTPMNLYTDPNAWGALLPAGKVGMAWTSPISPETMQSYPSAQLQVLNLPAGPAGRYIVGGVGFLCVAKKSKYHTQGFQYIKFLVDDANVKSYLRSTLLFPVKDLGANLYEGAVDPRLATFLDDAEKQSKNIRLTRVLPYSPDEYLIGEINNYLLGSVSLDSMLQSASSQIQIMARNAGVK